MGQQKFTEKSSNFSERLKFRLERLGMQQTTLAEKVGVSPSAISNWIKGDNEAKGDNLQRLADALGVDVWWLSGGDAEPAAAQMQEAPPVSDLETWKRRAKEAEKRLADLRDALRSLLELSSQSPPVEPPKPVSSSKPSETRRAAEKLLHLDPSEHRDPETT